MKLSHVRRRSSPFVVGLLALSAASGCAARSAVPSLPEAQKKVVAYLDSGAYDRDFAAVVAQARAYVETRAKAVARPAIVLDVDETSLSNWPAYRANGWGRITAGPCELPKGPCGLRAWQASAQSKALAPTVGLVRRARELGVAVFFVTGRPPELREATEKNLREQGYEWDGVVLQPAGATFASAVDFKAPERRKIARGGLHDPPQHGRPAERPRRRLRRAHLQAAEPRLLPAVTLTTRVLAAGPCPRRACSPSAHAWV